MCVISMCQCCHWKVCEAYFKKVLVKYCNGSLSRGVFCHLQYFACLSCDTLFNPKPATVKKTKDKCLICKTV